MGGLFSKKKIVWVPVNEKLEEKCNNTDQWQTQESFKGWKVCNDGGILAKAIGKCTSTGKLDLSYCGLGDKEAVALAAALKQSFGGQPGSDNKLGTIKSLDLSNNSIHKDGFAAICKALDPPTDHKLQLCLEDINFSNNYGGPEGARYVGEMIRKNRVIRKVSLKWNNIGNRGICDLGSSLSTHHRDCKIDISHNMFDLTDAEELHEMVKSVRKILGPENVDGDDGGVIIGWSSTKLCEIQV